MLGRKVQLIPDITKFEVYTATATDTLFNQATDV